MNTQLGEQALEELTPEQLEEIKKRKEAIKKFLEKAPVLLPGELTVDRINALHSKNQATIAFLSKFSEDIKQDAEKDLCETSKSMLQLYLLRIQEFTEKLI